MSLKINYNLIIDFANPQNNKITPKEPLVQGTDVVFDIILLENAISADIDASGTFTAYVVNYNKLDSAFTVLSDDTLTIDTTGLSNANPYITITGKSLTSNVGLCSLMIKYEKDNVVSFANPLQYYVKENPIYDLNN